jgi:hypothetical protein
MNCMSTLYVSESLIWDVIVLVMTVDRIPARHNHWDPDERLDTIKKGTIRYDRDGKIMVATMRKKLCDDIVVVSETVENIFGVTQVGTIKKAPYPNKGKSQNRHFRIGSLGQGPTWFELIRISNRTVSV